VDRYHQGKCVRECFKVFVPEWDLISIDEFPGFTAGGLKKISIELNIKLIYVSTYIFIL
jgi:hypothetical protein